MAENMDQNFHIRGQITLIRLQNFMTFDYIELRPGFNLNLIIGPNGTGKSSFVCAVMLAFGAKLKSIGRADSIKSFVKNGCEEAIIDLELYEPLGENLTISRKIDVLGNSQYSINGKPANSAKVAEVRTMYNISLDNLCSFLPQEKVQDFSRLTPQQLLEQTQKAAGTEQMVSDYNQLKDLLQEVRGRERHHRSLTEDIDELQEKNNRIKDRVMAYIENQALCEKEILLKQKRAWLLYSKALDEFKEAESLASRAERECEENETEYENILEVVAGLQNCLMENDRQLKEIVNQRAELIKRYREKLKSLRRVISRLENFDHFVQSKHLEEERKRAELILHRENLDKLVNDLNNFVRRNGTDEELKAKEKRVNSEIESCQKEEAEMMEKKAAIEDELEQLKTEIKNISIECRLLEKRKNFRLEYLKRYEPDVYRSVEWLKENKHLFQGPIFNPMLLELDIMDVKYAKFIEARIPFRDLISFTCTNPDDLNLLVTKLRTELKLKVNVICSEDNDISQYSPEIPLDEIRHFGFSSYMKDFITGPPEIIGYLCKVYKIHTVPVGDESVNKKCDKVPRQVTLFFSENHMFSVRVSVYSGEKAITVKRLNEPKIFSVLLNNQKIKELSEREKELVNQSEEKETELKIAKQLLKDLTEKQEDLRQAKRYILTHMSEKDRIADKVKRAGSNVREIENTIKHPEDIQQELEEERRKRKTEINDCLAGIKTLVSELQEVTVLPNEKELRKDVTKFSLERVSLTKDEFGQALEKCRENVEYFNRKKVMKELQCRSLREGALALTKGVSPADKNFARYESAFCTVKDTVAELDADLARIKVISEFMGGGDAQLKAEYDDRQYKINDLSDLLSESKEVLKTILQQFDLIRQRWLSAVNDLVSRINESYGNFFEAMGCVGEVRLITAANKDDIDKYGIEIRVKFRDGVPLHPLGRHFQSGGERAVATAVYLLSLQELVTVPFRFVDEINQGMDPVNEKRIIDLMIKVTDRSESVQYFFITPKLLPDIECSETMVVHSIYSGPIVFPSKLWNLNSYLN